MRQNQGYFRVLFSLIYREGILTLMNIVSILGRQPELSMAELEQRFGSSNVRPFSDIAATVETDSFDIQTLGGSVKAGKIIAELDRANWDRLSRDIVQRYARELKGEGKLTLGMSVYGLDVAPRDVQRTGLALKQTLKKQGRSVRLIPNDGAILSSATSHHNKLGLSDNKVELMVVYGNDSVIVAESTGTQNITALAKRDQARPKRDAFVGMLPPKLALMMINLSGVVPVDVSSPGAKIIPRPSSGAQPEHSSASSVSGNDLSEQGEHTGTILDPFCGTGVVLQEAALLGFDVYGTDLAEKMVDYTTQNMQWLANGNRIGNVKIEAGDAIEHKWSDTGSIKAVVAETYLGQPFSAPPSADKLEKVVKVVDTITEKFLVNIHDQLKPGTSLCLAVPAWRSATGWFTYLPVIKKIESLGYHWQQLATVDPQKLTYYREDQVVARQLLLLTAV